MQAQRGLGELRLLDFLTSALYGGSVESKTVYNYTINLSSFKKSNKNGCVETDDGFTSSCH
jgi:hypothetical protein